MNGAILTINAGSSSLKFALFEMGADAIPRLRGRITGIGRAPAFSAHSDTCEVLDTGLLGVIDAASSHEAITALLIGWLEQHQGTAPLLAVGHRVVHGGSLFTTPVQLDDAVLRALEALIPLAPLHQPHNTAAIRAVAKWHPEVPQIACFDTSFHNTQHQLAKHFALPRALRDEGVRRYGFHGLSYEYIASQLPKHLGHRADGRVIVAHLGNGASMCALKNRQSVATSMGFTALDGLMMGRRCGALDPGVVLYLMQARGMDAAQIETLLYRHSGLLGVSGISNSMEVLERADDPNAREAIDLYCYRAASVLGGLVPAIGGLDAIVFTAGIGENSARVRRKICNHLAWLGVALDETANERHGPTLSAPDASVTVLTLPTDEEAIVAQACARFVYLGTAGA